MWLADRAILSLLSLAVLASGQGAPFEIHINFGPQTTRQPASGWVRDSGQYFSDRDGQAFGWDADRQDAGVRYGGSAGDDIFDSFIPVNRIAGWRIQLSSGLYEVQFSIGDSAVNRVDPKLTIQGAVASIPREQITTTSFGLPSGQFRQGLVHANVEDGFLRIGSLTDNAPLNFVRIVSVNEFAHPSNVFAGQFNVPVSQPPPVCRSSFLS